MPAILLRMWWRGRKNPAYRQRLWERFGYYKTDPLPQCIWLHAASYGETVAAEQLIEQLLSHYPELPLLITNMTITGSNRVRERFKDRVRHVYTPYDVPAGVKRFLKHFKPKLGIIIETELWPNLLEHCHDQNIPILLANARLSESSARGYNKIKKFTKKMLGCLTHIAAQSQTDADRFLFLGANSDQISVVGNLKCDISADKIQIEQGKAKRSTRPTWIAASTHDGEETQVLASLASVKKQHPDSLLILVPRHPERFDDVTQLCQAKGFKTQRYTSKTELTSDVDILIGDTMGQLYYFYAMADIAFVGGSLVPIGGHNILEAIVADLPVITGPHLFSIAEMNQQFPTPACRLEATNSDTLAKAVIMLLDDKNTRRQLTQSARTALMSNHGALDKHIGLIKNITPQL